MQAAQDKPMSGDDLEPDHWWSDGRSLRVEQVALQATAGRVLEDLHKDEVQGCCVM